MMKFKPLLSISLFLNLIFLVWFVTLAVIYRDKLIQRFVTWKGDCKIVMFGNSITAQGRWVELLDRTDVVNSGLPGLSTYHFVDMLQSQIIDLHPKICFVMGGINDITVGVAQEKIQANYKTILETIRKNGIIPIVTLTLYEQNDPVSKVEIEKLNRFLVAYCRDNKIEYLDLNAVISDSTGLQERFARDKTHLNDAGYGIWAEKINEVLKRRKI